LEVSCGVSLEASKGRLEGSWVVRMAEAVEGGV
jgi:hypothetical protein